MPQIGENRVFDKTSLEELKEQATALLDCATAVTEELKTQTEKLKNIAAEIPPEAKDASLDAAASALLATLDPGPFETMKNRLTQILDKLTTLVPSHDAQSGSVFSELTASAVSLKGMVSELTGLIGSGSLSLSLKEFSGRLEEYQKKWQEGALTLAQKMELAMTCLKGMVSTSRFSKDPVNLSTGNFYYEKEDLKIRGLMPLLLKRCYNALDQSGGSLGHGWSHSLEVFLAFPEKQPGTLLLHKGDGKELPFRKQEEKWKDIHTGRETIEETEDGYRYREGNLCHTFDKNGKRLTCGDENGNTLSFTYDETGLLLTASQGDFGGSLHFTYKDGRLKEATDHTGRKLTFHYVEGRLDEVTDPEGHTTSYRYDTEGRIRAVKNPRGILSVRNEYDGKGRVTRQRFPDKGEMRYEYLDAENRTILTERNGSRILYEQDNKLRNIRTIYHDSEESTAYNEKDQIVSRTNRNGNRTVYAYDGQGNLTTVINALKEKTSFTYNEKGKLLTISSQGTSLLKNIYDEKGKLIETSDALGRTRRNIFDEKGLVTAIENPDGSRTYFDYDKKGNIHRITDPYGAVTEYHYDALNRVIETIDANGSRTQYSYDQKDRLVCVINAEENSRTYTYNESGKVVKVKDFDGGIMEVEYNHLNRPERLLDKLGRETKRIYDLMWNVSEEIAPTGAVTRYQYDQDNRLMRIEICGEKEKNPTTVIKYAHDSTGNLTEAEAGDAALVKGGASLSKVCYEYDALNRTTAITDGEGHTTRYAYDAMGNVSSVTDTAGNKRTFTYNALGERLTDTDERGNTTVYEYNRLGQVCCITDSIGRKTIYEYEPGGRLQRLIRPDGSYFTYTYDRKGNIRTKTNREGYVLTYNYDCMDRVTEVSGSNGERKSYTYDALGNVTAMTDANGNTTTYEYTLSGKLAAVTDALGNRAEYSYDALDCLICVCQKGKEGEADRITRYARNPLGQMETAINALGEEEHYTYDAMGRVLTKTDRDGFITTSRYTSGGKRSQILYGDGKSVEMEYDALNHLIRVKDWLGITEIERDSIGAPIRIRDHEGREISYEWGSLGERKGITYPDGKIVRYEYDHLLRLSALRIQRDMEQEHDEVIRYFYDASGRLSEKQFPDGLKTAWMYNGIGQLSELIHEDAEGILDHYRYTYDAMGNKTAIEKYRRGLEKENGQYGYSYDALGRLAEVMQNDKKVREYRYDSFGNRNGLKDWSRDRTTVYTYDAANRLLYQEVHEDIEKVFPDGMETEGFDIVKTDYIYDHRGNMVEECRNGALLHGYEYDATNRLARVWNREEEAFYQYNGLGQRVRRRVNGQEENYLLDLSRPYHNLLGFSKDGRTQTFYWDGIVAAMEENVRESGNDISSPVQEMHYYLQDELGSPLRVSGYAEQKGQSYLTYGYDEFGNDLYKQYEEQYAERYTGQHTGPYADLAAEGIPNPYEKQGEVQPFGYTGYRKDAVSGTYFAQAREYSSGIGRFTAEDVIRGNGAVPITLNRYGYCWENPLRYNDRDGKCPVEFYVPIIEPVMDGFIKYVKDAYEVYKKQREENPPPVFPADTTGLIDYTEIIDEWRDEKLHYFQDNSSVLIPSAGGFILTEAILLKTFYDQVKTGGPMDIKDKANWYQAFGFERPDFLIYHGEVMDPGTLGNIIYGYVGASLFPDFMLYYGGGFANMKNSGEQYIPSIFFLPCFGDAPEDYEAVKKGIEMWNEESQCPE